MATHKRFRRLSFYWIWAKGVLSFTFGTAERVGGLLGIFVPGLVSFIKWRTNALDSELEGALSDLRWMLPTGVLVFFLALRLFMVPYHLFRSMQDERDSLILQDDRITEELSRLHHEGAILHTKRLGRIDNYAESGVRSQKRAWDGYR